ncbi:MAG: hypothetical protein NTZ44_02460 [Candidatus Nomurabacteria bacterium]|nr:hypothetical protein [Candidatus Nomurabacteria bacterium]
MQNNSKINIILLVFILALSLFVLFMENKNSNMLMSILDKQTESYVKPQKATVTENPLQTASSDLVSFSISPNTKVHGILSYRGVLQGGYFFEGNVLVNILDINKKVLKSSNAVAKSEWMTSGPVNFEGNIDFTGLPKGSAYFEIHNDNPSGEASKDKSILIPIIIE